MGAAGGRGTAGVGGQRVPLKWQSAMRLFCSTSVRATKFSASACQDVPRHGQRAANSFKHLSLSLPAAALYATHARGGTVLRRLWACNFVSNFRLSSTQYQHRPKPALIPCSPALYLPASPPAACCLLLPSSPRFVAFTRGCQSGSVSYDVLASTVEWPQDLGQAYCCPSLPARPCSCCH